MDEVNLKLLSLWQTALQQTTTIAPKLIAGLLLFMVSWAIAATVKLGIVRLARHASRRIYLYRILGSLTRNVILFLGLVTALGTVGVNIGALIAGLGLAGFAIGFALKDVLSNVIAGFLLLFYQPFKAGNHISVNKIEGQVVDVTLRYTVIKTITDRTFIPNATVLNSPLIVRDAIEESLHG